MLCLVARHQDDVRRFPLPGEAATIGKSEENDIVLPFLGVSRRHALLTRTGAGLLLSDAGSKNGLFADGSRVPSIVLELGRAVQIGAAFIAIEEADTAELNIAFNVQGNGDRMAHTAPTDALLERAAESDALSLIGAIERRGSARENAQAIVVELRRVLHATTVQLLEERNGESGVLALAGPPLPVAVIVDAVARVATEQSVEEDIRRIDDATVVVSGIARRGRIAVLAVRFTGPPRAITASERSLLSYVASKLMATSREDRRPAADREPLRRDEIVYASRPMRVLLDAVSSIATSERPILIHGETGTGKELIARLLHETGPHASGRFLAVNCAEIPKDLIESELFGVERGVATGVEARIGLFAAADGGTLFLDEIGELPQATQASLLRVLERREVRAVGGRMTRPVRLRIVLATRRALATEAGEAAVRDDLFYRCLLLSIPPLRDRREDVVPLALHFLERTCLQARVDRLAISEKAIDLLVRHDWPGNVRELEHAVEEAVLRFGRGGILHSEHFAAVLHTTPSASSPATLPSSLHAAHEDLDRERIERALRETRGNKAAAARLLGLSRNGLLKKMARFSR